MDTMGRHSEPKRMPFAPLKVKRISLLTGEDLSQRKTMILAKDTLELHGYLWLSE